jgi:CBS domain containing-hemolysin-like protein
VTPEPLPAFPAASPAADEDPLPTRRQAGSPASRKAAAAFLPIGAGALALVPGDLPMVTVVATVSPLHVLVCVAATALATVGTFGTASLIGYSPTLLSQHLGESDHPRRNELVDELRRLDREYLIVALVLTAAGWIVGLWALQHAIDPDHRVWAGILFGLVMVLAAGSVPLAITQLRAEATVLALRPAVRGAWWVLRWPIVQPLLWATRLVLFALRIREPATGSSADVQRQVISAVADSVTHDTLADAERTWIGNIVGLKDLQVSAVMTPRPDIIAFPETMPLREVVQMALEHGFSRYPVFRDRIDEIAGVFYVKDALRLLQTGTDLLPTTPVRTMVREPLFVPETMGVAQLLRKFQAANLHMAIVIDEYGTTAGLVSIEDVLEEIVGDLGDEYDEPPTQLPAAEQIRVVEAGRVLELPARTSVADVNRLLGTELPEDGDWETVAGLVIATCNHIPAVDEAVVVTGVEFRVLAGDERRILRLRATVLAPEPAEDPR